MGRPVDMVRSLSARRRSGELICATSAVEIHLYLQEGRVAWAIDSRHPLAFTKHLQATTDIDRDTLAQVIDECRREKLPLGETLVAWGLATWETVRESLRHQITAAVTLLCTIADAKTIFLERGYDRYNRRLTFELAELIGDGTSPGATPGAHDAPPPGIIGQLRDAIDGLRWAEVIDGERVIESSPATDVQRTPIALLCETVLDGADFFAIRTSTGSVVGVRLAPPGRSLWCELDSSSTFGAAISALWAIVTASPEPADLGRAPRPSVRQFAGDSEAPSARELSRFLERAPEIAAAIVERGGQLSLGFAADSIEPEHTLALIRRRRACLDPELWSEADSGVSLDCRWRQMATGEGRLWLFGGVLGAGERMWLALDRRSAQGLGWACLSALERNLSASGIEPT